MVILLKNFRVKPEFDLAKVERGLAFKFSFDGQNITAFPGETVGAALTAAGISTFRTTRLNGKARGLFCGIGICFDCLVVVNGRPNLRACLTPVKAKDKINSQTGSAGEFFSSED